MKSGAQSFLRARSVCRPASRRLTEQMDRMESERPDTDRMESDPTSWLQHAVEAWETHGVMLSLPGHQDVPVEGSDCTMMMDEGEEEEHVTTADIASSTPYADACKRQRTCAWENGQQLNTETVGGQPGFAAAQGQKRQSPFQCLTASVHLTDTTKRPCLMPANHTALGATLQ